MTKKSSHILANLTEVSETKLSSLKSDALFDAIILKTNFGKDQIGKHSIISESDSFIQTTLPLIDKCCSKLKDGGLVFIYGLPNYLSFFGEYLSDNKPDEYSYLFKYWISCEFKAEEIKGELPNAHIGLLMYLKTKSKKNTTPFDINTKFVRLPYSDCTACGNMTKDWGGKKHMLNPLGSAISDVWSFNNIPIKKASKIPAELSERILALLSEGKNVLQVNQTKAKTILSVPESPIKISTNGKSLPLEINEVLHQSCIDYLNELHQKNPHGVFDVAFADPPYNLAKNYSTYQDDLEERKYINWCNEWLLGMYNNLKPGGALLVLNIPKWSVYHFNFLADKMIFQNWIVWDALSTPAGKLLPAHYSLLYFTKKGGNPKVNLGVDKLIDSREYCLRNSCVKKRKISGDDRKELLSDVWKDIHRIKHKKDRDHHPCQLPTKLMERIIKIFSNEGDIIFDPFGGAGTTAIAAKLLNRNFVITELDKKYVDIAQRNLSKIQSDMYGTLIYERDSVFKPQINGTPRKHIEKAYMQLCFTDNKTYSKEELKLISPLTYSLIENYSGDFNKLQAATKRKMEASLFLVE
ncbi:MAG: site-specific DNA-methyltransferase [Chitinophagaceae bacterium]|nr:site-specific DNA-methyltransferase [Chitinophagaceae bacterium]HQZ26330.1 site-specific DNA-methyltransferase [Flavobacterium sp.]